MIEVSFGSVRKKRAAHSPIRPMQRLILALLVATLGTSLGHAQSQPLTGIESLSVLVEELDQDSAGCGLADDVVRPAVADAFREGGVAVSDVSDPVVAYVKIATTVRENSGQCASDYEISLMARVEVAPSFSAESISGLLSLTSAAGSVSSARSDHPLRVTSGLADLARDLATQVHLSSEPTARAEVDPAATTEEEGRAYRVARCRELLSSPRLVPPETRMRDLQALKCLELIER